MPFSMEANQRLVYSAPSEANQSIVYSAPSEANQSIGYYCTTKDGLGRLSQNSLVEHTCFILFAELLVFLRP